jgi:hypothetical protein
LIRTATESKTTGWVTAKGTILPCLRPSGGQWHRRVRETGRMVEWCAQYIVGWIMFRWI